MKGDRDSRFELCRIIAMAVIVLAHYSWHGGVYFNGNIPNQIIGSFLAVGGKLGVDLFIIISAWFMSDRVNWGGYKSVLKVAVKVTIFNIVFATAYFVIAGKIPGIMEIFKALLGVIYGYWFITVYLMLILISPALNQYISNANKNELHRTCLILYVVAGVLPIMGISYTAELCSFVLLYLMTAYCKKYVHFKMRMCVTASIIILCFIVTGDTALKFSDSDKVGMLLNDSAGLLMLPLAFCIFGMFEQIRTFHSRFVNYIAKSMVTVYLFHDNGYIRIPLWKTLRCEEFYFSDTMILHAVVCLAIILLTGILVDQIYQAFEIIVVSLKKKWGIRI